MHDLWHNGKEAFRNGHYLTHLITEHAVSFLRNAPQASGDQPFFLYVPFNAPHWPLHAPPEYLDRFRGLSPERRIMAAMVSALRWPAGIPGGQVIEEVGAAIDIFPTFLKMAGGDPASYEVDGQDILGMLAKGAPSPHGRIFWEMEEQTAVRDGRWKLVLKGRLVEGGPPEDDVHLADMDADPGERHNLRDQHPDVVAELTAACESWRAGIEDRWQREWLPAAPGTT